MLIGHESIVAELKARAASGALHHAQLFIGPEHVGKTKVALALSVFLQGGEENVILKKQILEGANPDTILYLDAGEGLSIEEVRAIVERASQSHRFSYLIFVIENLGRMKPEAANALLKTLEEPGAETIFFLTAHQEEDVLSTIQSRCHVTRFQTVPDELMKAATEEHPAPEELLFFAMGRPGRLLRLKENPELLAAHKTVLQDLVLFLENPKTATVYDLIRKYEGHELLPELLDILLQRTRTWALARRVPAERLEQIETAKQNLKQNVNAKLVLENLLLTFVP